jgi:glutaredoxin
MKRNTAIVGMVIIIILAIALYFVFFSKPTGQVTTKDSFAKCLTARGATFYGSSSCGHCTRQKELFGSSFQYIKYIECSMNQELCRNAGVLAYPTWVINGQTYVGEKTFQELADLAGCKAP